VYKFTKDYHQWQPLSKKITLSKRIIKIIKKDNLALSKKSTTKDTITKDNKTNIYNKAKKILFLSALIGFQKRHGNNLRPCE